MSLFRKPAPEPQPVAVVQTRTMPMGVNISDQAKIDHARYRLSAIARHVEQHDVSDGKREEFYSEALVHLANLRHAKALKDGEFVEWTSRIGLVVI